MSTKPIVTRLAAPAKRLPVWESFGSTELLLREGEAFAGAAINTDVRASAARTCVSVVIYIATPGTFL